MTPDDRISDAAVEKATGKPWSAWLELLDAWGAAEAGHSATAAHLAEEHGLSGWWAQTVAVHYERERGLRVVGQKSDGSFAAQAQRTMDASASDAFLAVSDEKRRNEWLSGTPSLQPRKLEAPGLARFTWLETGRARSTTVEFRIEETNDDRCTVVVQHTKLDSKEGRDMLKAYWVTALERLEATLVG